MTTIKSVKPYGNQVLVVQDESEKKIGSLFVPQTAEKKPSTGKVFSVGPGKQVEDGSFLPIRLKEGDLILFTKFSGTEVRTPYGSFLLVDADAIQAVFETEEAQ